MASFTSIFSSPSPFQDVVDSATSELLMNQDWTKTFEIIDTINRDPSCSADMVKAIKKRLGMKKTTVIIRSLQLIDALVKNCSFELHKAMSDQWFSLLEKLATGRRGPEVQNESLLLIQRCGKAFQGMQREAPMFYRLYETLRTQNVRFPVDDEATNTAMLAPPKAVIAEAKKERAIAAQNRKNIIATSNMNRRSVTQQQQRLQQTNHFMSRADAIAKLQKEFAMVEERAKRFTSLKLAPGSDVYLDEVDFLEQCHIRLQELVASVSQYAFDETLLSQVLNINDLVGEAIATTTKTSTTINKDDKQRSVVADGGKKNDNKNLDNDLLGLSDLNIGVANISTSSKVTKNVEAGISVEKSNDKNLEINISNSKNALEQSMASDNPFDIFGGTTSTYGVAAKNSNSNNMIDSTSNNNNNNNSSINNATAVPISTKSSNDDMLNDFFGENDGNSGGAIPLPSTDNNQNNKNKQQPLTKTKTDDLLDDFFS